MNPARLFARCALLVLLSFATLDAGADDKPAEASLADRLASGTRLESDRQRDSGRKPADVIAFLGVEPGMQVVDLIAAGGYYTEVLAVAVGSEGLVYAQNPPRVLKFRDGANDEAMTARLADDRLPNVRRLDRDLGHVDLAAGSVDFAITALNFHDVYNSSGEAAAVDFLRRVLEFLKPGGVLGLIDHSGAAGNDNTNLHRIEEAIAVKAVQQAGFEIVATSDLLRNSADDRSTQVFDPAIRGKTDRFLFKLRKPL